METSSQNDDNKFIQMAFESEAVLIMTTEIASWILRLETREQYIGMSDITICHMEEWWA